MVPLRTKGLLMDPLLRMRHRSRHIPPTLSLPVSSLRDMDHMVRRVRGTSLRQLRLQAAMDTYRLVPGRRHRQSRGQVTLAP